MVFAAYIRNTNIQMFASCRQLLVIALTFLFIYCWSFQPPWWLQQIITHFKAHVLLAIRKMQPTGISSLCVIFLTWSRGECFVFLFQQNNIRRVHLTRWCSSLLALTETSDYWFLLQLHINPNIVKHYTFYICRDEMIVRIICNWLNNPP